MLSSSLRLVLLYLGGTTGLWERHGILGKGERVYDRHIKEDFIVVNLSSVTVKFTVVSIRLSLFL